MKKLLLVIVACGFLLDPFSGSAALGQDQPTIRSLGPFGGNVVSIAISPSNPQTSYALADGSVFITTNGGILWTKAANGRSMNLVSLLVHSSNQNTVFASSNTDVCYRSIDRGMTWKVINSGITSSYGQGLARDPVSADTYYITTKYGVFKTIDGGNSWSSIFDQQLLNSTIAIGSDPKVIYVASSSRVYKTDNGGINWAVYKIKPDPSTISIQALAVNPVDSHIAYAGDFRSGLYKTIDGGESWTPVTTDSKMASVTSVLMDPKNPETVYVSSDKGIFKSTDDGTTWKTVSIGVYTKCMAMDQSTPQTIYAGMIQGGGISKTVDGGTTWKGGGANSSELAALSISASALDSSATMYVAPVGFDGLYKESTHTGWKTIPVPLLRGGVIFVITPDPTSHNTIRLGSSRGLLMTTDGGKSWVSSNSGLSGSIIYMTCLATDHFDSQTLYAVVSGGKVFAKTTDGAKTWKTYSSLPVSSITSIVPDPKTAKTVYVSTDTGVFRTVDGGNLWVSINGDSSSASNILWDFNTSHLVLDPTDPNILYVGAGSKGVFKTTDGGRIWSRAVNGLRTTTFVGSLEINKFNSRVVYLGFSVGLFKSKDGANSWTEVLPTELSGKDIRWVAVDPLNSQVVYINANGDGIYAVTFPLPYWPSDFNQDGKVDLDDFFIFAMTFGLRDGEIGFSPVFDLDKNGVIDLNDFFWFAGEFNNKSVLGKPTRR